jgi:protein-S-isoprenylcysteine O-methyltransferase Ste14
VSLRAKLEERSLRRDLSDEAYAAYRARVPMLVPFAKAGSTASKG